MTFFRASEKYIPSLIRTGLAIVMRRRIGQLIDAIITSRYVVGLLVVGRWNLIEPEGPSSFLSAEV